MASADAARAGQPRAAEPAPAPAPAESPMAALSRHWGQISFSGDDVRSVRIREMLIPESITTAARALIDAIDAVRNDRIVTLTIGAGDRAWPTDIPRCIENAEHLRLAIRRELERRGYRFVAGTPAAGVWQLGPITGRDTIGWRFRLTAPRRSSNG